MSELLRIDQLDVGYGDFQALFGIDLTVAEAETVSIIGANGAGKSTLLKAIVGLVQPIRGDILFDGTSVATGLLTAASPTASRWFPRAGASSRRSPSRRTSSSVATSAGPGPGTRRRCSRRSRCWCRC